MENRKNILCRSLIINAFVFLSACNTIPPHLRPIKNTQRPLISSYYPTDHDTKFLAQTPLIPNNMRHVQEPPNLVHEDHLYILSPSGQTTQAPPNSVPDQSSFPSKNLTDTQNEKTSSARGPSSLQQMEPATNDQNFEEIQKTLAPYAENFSLKFTKLKEGKWRAENQRDSKIISVNPNTSQYLVVGIPNPQKIHANQCLCIHAVPNGMARWDGIEVTILRFVGWNNPAT